MLRNIILEVNPQARDYFRGKRYSFDEFCAACEEPNISKSLGCSSAILSKYLKDLFPDRPKAVKVAYWLYTQSDVKPCGGCGELNNKTDFYSNSSNSDGLNSQCKICHKSQTADTQAGRQAQYRATQNIPAWANLEEIKKIYEKCPKGYHVDHIIPLQGKEVSGLHVETNLQYLPAIENLRKSNKMVV